MVSKILIVVFISSASYCASTIVFLQKADPIKGRCATVDCFDSVHQHGEHTFDCKTTEIINGNKVEGVFYLKRQVGKKHVYDVVLEDGSATGRTTTMEKDEDDITTYKEKDTQGNIVINWCATDTRNPVGTTQANVNIKCLGLPNVDNTNC